MVPITIYPSLAQMPGSMYLKNSSSCHLYLRCGMFAVLPVIVSKKGSYMTDWLDGFAFVCPGSDTRLFFGGLWG